MRMPQWRPLRTGGFALSLLVAATAARAAEPPRVLIVYSETTKLPAVNQLDDGLREALQRSDVAPRIYEEYLDTRRFPQLAGGAEQARWWEHKYKDDRPDVIVAVNRVALQSLRPAGTLLWPDVPIVFTVVSDDQLAGFELPPHTTGVSHRFQVRETADLVHHLLPDVRRIVVPFGTSPLEISYRSTMRQGMEGVHERIGLTYDEWDGLTLDEMQDRLRSLPPDAAAMILVVNGDRATPSMTPAETAQALAAASSRPIFSPFGSFMGTGVVGGLMIDFRSLGVQTGEVVTRVLSGEPAESIPVVQAASRLMFDARSLRRFGIPRSRLPAGAEILFDEPSVWQRYRPQIITALALFVLQTAIIGVLLEHRRRRVRVQARLDRTLRFERLLSDVATTLSRTSRTQPTVLVGLLERMSAPFDGECAALVQWYEDARRAPLVTVWNRGAAPGNPVGLFASAPAHDAARSGVTSRLSSVTALRPADAAVSREQESSPGWAILQVPLAAAGQRTAALGIARAANRAWTDDEVERLQTIGQPFAAWVQREWAHSEMESASALNQALVTSLASQAAVVDTTGVVQWLGNEPGAALPAWFPYTSGVNIVATLEKAANVDALRLRDAIVQVLDGSSGEIALECVHRTGQDQIWFEVQVRPLQRPEKGAAVTVHDITVRKRLEFEQQMHLQEMAHLDRVASLGALATSLAHELNQPLTAILANAQAAQVMLDRDTASMSELHDTLADIVDDDRRAGDIIHRMRRLLKKGEVAVETVDLNALSRDAIRLVSPRAARHRLTIEPALCADPVLVVGDGVQLQQVIVNLLLNAIDASADRHQGARRIVIETSTGQDGRRLAVHDSGPGVDPAQLPHLFHPFFTTKKEGLGMGLSISRTIVEAHRGRIWAERGETGATFRLAFADRPQAAR